MGNKQSSDSRRFSFSTSITNDDYSRDDANGNPANPNNTNNPNNNTNSINTTSGLFPSLPTASPSNLSTGSNPPYSTSTHSSVSTTGPIGAGVNNNNPNNTNNTNNNIPENVMSFITSNSLPIGNGNNLIGDDNNNNKDNNNKDKDNKDKDKESYSGSNSTSNSPTRRGKFKFGFGTAFGNFNEHLINPTYGNGIHLLCQNPNLIELPPGIDYNSYQTITSPQRIMSLSFGYFRMNGVNPTDVATILSRYIDCYTSLYFKFNKERMKYHKARAMIVLRPEISLLTSNYINNNYKKSIKISVSMKENDCFYSWYKHNGYDIECGVIGIPKDDTSLNKFSKKFQKLKYDFISFGQIHNKHSSFKSLQCYYLSCVRHTDANLTTCRVEMRGPNLIPPSAYEDNNNINNNNTNINSTKSDSSISNINDNGGGDRTIITNQINESNNNNNNEDNDGLNQVGNNNNNNNNNNGDDIDEDIKKDDISVISPMTSTMGGAMGAMGAMGGAIANIGNISNLSNFGRRDSLLKKKFKKIGKSDDIMDQTVILYKRYKRAKKDHSPNINEDYFWKIGDSIDICIDYDEQNDKYYLYWTKNGKDLIDVPNKNNNNNNNNNKRSSSSINNSSPRERENELQTSEEFKDPYRDMSDAASYWPNSTHDGDINDENNNNNNNELRRINSGYKDRMYYYRRHSSAGDLKDIGIGNINNNIDNNNFNNGINGIDSINHDINDARMRFYDGNGNVNDINNNNNIGTIGNNSNGSMSSLNENDDGTNDNLNLQSEENTDETTLDDGKENEDIPRSAFVNGRIELNTKDYYYYAAITTVGCDCDDMKGFEWRIGLSQQLNSPFLKNKK